MSDGWIIPFVWCAGLAGAGLPGTVIGQAGLIITITAAAAMWLGAFFSAREADEDPDDARTWALYTEIGLSADTQELIREGMISDQAQWDQKIREDYQLSSAQHALQGAGWQIGTTYLLSGLLLLLPFFVVSEVQTAFYWSAGITAAGLLLLSFWRSRLLHLSFGACVLRYFSLAIVAAALAFFIGRQLAL